MNINSTIVELKNDHISEMAASTLPQGEYFIQVKCRSGQGYPLVATKKKVTVLPIE